MTLKQGDTITAAIGFSPEKWTVERMFNDGTTDWVTLKTDDGVEFTTSVANLAVAIKRGTQSELTEVEVDV